MKRPSAAVLTLILSLVLVLVAAVVIVVVAQRDRQEAEIANVGDRGQITASPSTLSTLRPTAAALPSASSTSSPSNTPSSNSSSALVLPEPVRVRIPRIGVDADVLPVGLDPAGAMALPEDITKVGWYDLGVPPGADRGSAVLAAHRDGRVQGHGVFYNLGQLDVGNKVAVYRDDGSVLIYQVVSRELISKQRLPVEELFSVDGPPRLTLISCGGYYDRNNGGYQDNVVVTAVPV